MVLIKFVLSCDLLWGYSKILDPVWFVDVEALIECVRTSLIWTLQQNGLDVLVEKTKDLKLHIHDYTLDKLKSINTSNNQNHVIYICDHC